MKGDYPIGYYIMSEQEEWLARYEEDLSEPDHEYPEMIRDILKRENIIKETLYKCLDSTEPKYLIIHTPHPGEIIDFLKEYPNSFVIEQNEYKKDPIRFRVSFISTIIKYFGNVLPDCNCDRHRENEEESKILSRVDEYLSRREDKCFILFKMMGPFMEPIISRLLNFPHIGIIILKNSDLTVSRNTPNSSIDSFEHYYDLRIFKMERMDLTKGSKHELLVGLEINKVTHVLLYIIVSLNNKLETEDRMTIEHVIDECDDRSGEIAFACCIAESMTKLKAGTNCKLHHAFKDLDKNLGIIRLIEEGPILKWEIKLPKCFKDKDLEKILYSEVTAFSGPKNTVFKRRLGTCPDDILRMSKSRWGDMYPQLRGLRVLIAAKDSKKQRKASNEITDIDFCNHLIVLLNKKEYEKYLFYEDIDADVGGWLTLISHRIPLIEFDENTKEIHFHPMIDSIKTFIEPTKIGLRTKPLRLKRKEIDNLKKKIEEYILCKKLTRQ